MGVQPDHKSGAFALISRRFKFAWSQVSFCRADLPNMQVLLYNPTFPK